jgi:glycosyltransferase involved in cell wall biosynthesis
MREITPTVSICIPAYGQPQRALKALQSVCEQDFDDYEVIFTDDTPNDSVYSAVESFFNDKRFRYFKNERSLGSPLNWNRAVELARGRFLKILHHDDWLLNKSSLRRFVQLLESNEHVNFAFCASQNCDGSGRPVYMTKASHRQLQLLEKDPTFLALGNFVGAPSATIYRRNEKFVFDAKLKWLVDIDFYMRILEDNRAFAFSSEPLVGITVGTQDQVTATSYQDKNIEISEAVYLLNSFTMHSRLSKYIYFSVWKLFIHFSIRSFDDVKSCGLTEVDITQPIKDILFYQRFYYPVVKAIAISKVLLSPAFWVRLIFRNISFGTSRIKMASARGSKRSSQIRNDF